MEDRIGRAFAAALAGTQSFDAAAFVDTLSARIVEDQTASNTLDIGQLRTLFTDARTALQRGAELAPDAGADGTLTASALLSQHHQTVCEIRERYEPIEEDLRVLSGKVTRVSGPAVRVGERLEALEAHRARALEIHEVVRNFDALNNPASTNAAAMKNPSQGLLDAVFTDPARVFDLAKIMKLLVPVAAELDAPSTERGKKCVESYAKQVETTMIAQFQEAMCQSDKPRMKRIADSLFEFNGGSSLVVMFLQMPRLFTCRDSFFGGPLDDPDTTIAAWPDTATPAASDTAATTTTTTTGNRGNNTSSTGSGSAAVMELPKLSRFLRKVCDELATEHETIFDVFPNPAEIMGQLVQKTMELCVRPFLDALLTNPRVPSVDYARVLHSACLFSRRFLATNLAPLVDSVAGMPLAVFLDTFFEPYLVPRRGDASCVLKESYMSAEMRACTSAFDTLLGAFQRTTDLYAEVEAANSTLLAQLTRNKNTTPLPPVSTLLTLDTAQKLISLNKQAVFRCCDVSKLPDLSNNLTTLCKLFLHQLYERYLQPALMLGESVVKKWSPSSTVVKSGEPFPIVRDYMGLLHTASAVVLSLFNYTASLVVPRLSSPQNTVTLKQVLSSGNIQNSSRTAGSPDDDGPLPSFLAKVEELLSKGLSACIDLICSGVQHAFQNQSKAVYNITEEELMAGLFATPVCKQVVGIVNCHIALAKRTMDKFNAARFASEVADHFVAMLISHIKHLTVTQSGGLLLMQDMTMYKECALRAGATTKRAELLTEIAKIYIVDASQLQAILQDSSLHLLDPAEFRALVDARADSRANASLLSKIVVKVKNTT